MSDESREIRACPHCNGSGTKKRNPDHPCSTADAEYYCTRCRRRFDEPVWRSAQQPGGHSGLAKELLDADPEEVL